MRLILKIFIFLLLLTSPLSVNSAEPEVLYLWQISSGHEWESYGDENVQQKYERITSNGEPDGKGIDDHWWRLFLVSGSSFPAAARDPLDSLRVYRWRADQSQLRAGM